MSRVSTSWRSDVLPGFDSAPIGTITLIRPHDNPSPPRCVVLHLHGYNDYFFQSHLAEAITARGHAFYAADLPRAGRSLRQGDVPHFASSVAEHTEAIDQAVNAVAALHPGVPVVLHAHSTGGLMACMWAADYGHPAVRGLILNSPLLGFVGARSHRLLAGLVPAVARFRPRVVVAISPSVYAFHQHISNGGRWDFDLALKRPSGVPIRAGWYAAVRVAQDRIREGLHLELPVLLARSDSSGPDAEQNPFLDSQDTVVDVDSIAQLGPRIGPRVRQVVIARGVHDLSLSSDGPREAYFKEFSSFIEEFAP